MFKKLFFSLLISTSFLNCMTSGSITEYVDLMSNANDNFRLTCIISLLNAITDGYFKLDDKANYIEYKSYNQNNKFFKCSINDASRTIDTFLNKVIDDQKLEDFKTNLLRIKELEHSLKKDMIHVLCKFKTFVKCEDLNELRGKGSDETVLNTCEHSRITLIEGFSEGDHEKIMLCKQSLYPNNKLINPTNANKVKKHKSKPFCGCM